MFGFFKRKPRPEEEAAARLYERVVAQARRPVFYATYGVPDTVNGRFEMIILHGFLVMHRLGNTEDEYAKAVSQALFDRMFRDMDRSLREMGISDLSVPKHMKRAISRFYARAYAYEEGVENPDVMAALIRRHVYGTADDLEITEEQLAALTGYVQLQLDQLEGLPLEEIYEADPVFAQAETLTKTDITTDAPPPKEIAS